jgi:hypothetical protein
MIPAAILNEQLKRVLPHVGANSANRIQQIATSPYLTHDGGDESFALDEAVTATLKDGYGMIRTPFPLFRFCCVSSKRTIFGCCERREGAIAAVFMVKERDGSIGPVVWSITYKGEPSGMSYDGRMFDSKTLADVTRAVADSDDVKDIHTKLCTDLRSVMTPLELKQTIKQAAEVIAKKEKALSVMRSEVDALIALEDLTKKSVPEGAMPETHDTFMALYGSLLILAYAYLAPHNFTARVVPDKQGKSVEWLRAREHYTVIHRHHAANNKAVSEGATVSDSKHTTRLAHSRRAHTKLLTHPRYTFKRGQRIFVRASWVGPKEWKDTAGQIYQILEPVS